MFYIPILRSPKPFTSYTIIIHYLPINVKLLQYILLFLTTITSKKDHYFWTVVYVNQWYLNVTIFLIMHNIKSINIYYYKMLPSAWLNDMPINYSKSWVVIYGIKTTKLGQDQHGNIFIYCLIRNLSYIVDPKKYRLYFALHYALDFYLSIYVFL